MSLNPRVIWSMVVFVTGLGFVAYPLGQTLGPERGIALSGIVIAAITNTVVKAALAWVLGTHRLGKLVGIVLGVVVLSGLVLIVV